MDAEDDMREIRVLTRTMVCAMTLAVGVPSDQAAAQSKGGGDSSTLESYAVKKGDVDSAAVRAVVSTLGSYRADTDVEVREVAYEKTKDLKRSMSTRKMSTRTKVLFGVAIAGTIVATFLIWRSAESAN